MAYVRDWGGKWKRVLTRGGGDDETSKGMPRGVFVLILTSLSQFGKEKNRPAFVFFRGFVFVMMIRNDRSCSLAGVSLEKTYPGVAREQEDKNKPPRETCRLASRPKWRDGRGRGGGYPILKATFFPLSLSELFVFCLVEGGGKGDIG